MPPVNIPPESTSRFVRACLRLPVDRTPVWFLRQAGRYMPEYMAVRKHHSLLDICRKPEIASERMKARACMSLCEAERK
jgi:uroporphyrinogen decarboxylase